MAHVDRSGPQAASAAAGRTDPAAAAPLADPATATGYAVVALADRLRRRFTDALAPLGLTPTQFSALAMLDGSPSITAAALARAILLRPQSVGPLLDQLEERGLVARPRRRGRGVAVPVVLTEAGRARLADGAAVVRRLDVADRAVLGRDRYAALGEAARDLAAHLEVSAG